ncbi:MAG: hypothetical protein HYS80_00075 [Candidatus Aenigmarchaeota archaeon]|nr:hypothetical protein [Candidatus Aenigmarchaeota archaeon]
MKIVIFSLLLLFLFLVTNTTAVSFTPTSDPTGNNAGQNNQLVNFSVQNTGGVNITQLNITLPPGFTFTGTSGTTTPSSYTALSSTPSWTNSSSVGIVGNGATQYFWIYVNTPSTTGSYSFNITALDANGAFSSNNVTFTLFDTLAPSYSSNTTSPSTNSTYSANQSYWFNITWTDGGGISKVLIEHNITGSSTPHNETMSNSSSVYYLNVRDLSAGIYVWRVYANDTNNTFNSTLQFTYLINQATNELKVYLNGTLNGNITSINNTAINITVNASCAVCTITISRDSTNIASGAANPYSKPDDVISSIGLHNYSISVSSNVNYTSNSSTYFVATVPSYSTPTSNIPLTFSNTAVGIINVTFTDNPNLVNVKIQGDWSGTSTNYTMSNFSVTNYYYNITFPAGTSNWKLYGTYGNHSFNLTTLNSFTINKASPSITLSITPQWTLDSPIQTNVSCGVGVSGLTTTLYRNNTSVTSPNVQTFTAGSVYSYLCNNTANQNYTTDTATNTLVIKPTPSTSLSFVQAPTIIEITQNSTNISEVKVKNSGTIAQNITLGISGMDASWYSLNQTTANVLIGSTTTFTITFKVGNDDVKDYPAKFNISSANATVSQDFTLRILPSNETKSKINDTLILYKLDANKLESTLGEVKTKINNTASIEQKLGELKSALQQAENYINSSNYFQAQQTLGTIKALISEVESQLKVTEPTDGVKISSKVWLMVGGVIIIIVVGILMYMFWPVKKGYKPETGEYVYGREEKRGLVNAFKNFLSKFKRKKKLETAISG